MIHIVDYGLGNVRAIMNVYYRLGIPACLASEVRHLDNADHIILPGVGSFDHAMGLLDRSGLLPTIERLVIGNKVPLLGICVGMQMLARASDEGRVAGLGWIPGNVKAFESHPQASVMPLPHMGWNDVTVQRHSPIMNNLEMNSRFYFLHSYYFECENSQNCVAVADYGTQFSCVVMSGNIYGAQFHPEKSHGWGTQLLKNFAEL